MKTYTYTKTGLPPVDYPHVSGEFWRLTPDLPFWWFLNPWKTVEDLQDSLCTANAEANEWHEKHQQEAKVVKSLSDQIYDLQNELETVRLERDAANDAVRHLRKKKGGRRD